MFTLTSILLASMAAAQSLPASQPASAPVAAGPVSPARIDELLANLAHPRYAVREKATQQLCHLDAASLPQLLKNYRAETRFEPKRRIRYAIEYIFFREQIVGRDGFLGIEVYQQLLQDVIDPASGKPVAAVLVRAVKPGFSADHYGVRPDDLLIAFDGRSIPEDRANTGSTLGFIQFVSGHPPGSTATLQLLRCGRPQTMSMELAAEPAQRTAGLRVQAITREIATPGLLVTGVEENTDAWRAGLRPNDIIRTVSGTRQEFGAAYFEGLIKNGAPGSRLVLEVVRPEPVSIHLKLGSRPPEYISDPKDRAEAQARFLQWWQDQGGDLSTTGGEHARPSRPMNPFQQAAPAIPDNSVIP